jgi:hypothetical protein
MVKAFFSFLDIKYPVNRIIILGGDRSSWHIALALQSRRPDISITVIDNKKVDDKLISTSMSYPSVWRMIHLDQDEQFQQESSAEFKLGITYKDWVKDGSQNVFVGFPDLHYSTMIRSLYSDRYDLFQSGNEISLLDCWLDLYQKGLRQDKDFATDLSETGALALNDKDPNDYIKNNHISSWIGWTFSFDNIQYINYLKKVSSKRGIRIIESDKFRINLTGKKIASIDIDGITFSADIFLDCVGDLYESIKNLYSVPWKSMHEMANDCIGTFAPSIRQSTRWTNSATLKPYGYDLSTTNQQRWQKICVTKKSEIQSLSDSVTDIHNYRPGYHDQCMIGNVIALSKAAGIGDPLDSASDNHENRMIGIITDLLIQTTDLLEMRERINHINRCLFEDIDRVNQYKICLCPRNDSHYWIESYTYGRDHDLLSSLYDDFNCFRRNPNTQNLRLYNASTLVNLCLHYGLPVPIGRSIDKKLSSLALEYFRFTNQRNIYLL